MRQRVGLQTIVVTKKFCWNHVPGVEAILKLIQKSSQLMTWTTLSGGRSPPLLLSD